MKILTMKNIAIPLGVLWVLLIIVAAAGYEESMIMTVIGVLMAVGVILLIIAFFIESKEIKRRQKKKKIETPTLKSENNTRLVGKEINSKYLFIGTIIAMFISPFLRDGYFGFMIVYAALILNGISTFNALIKWTTGKKIDKRNLILSALFVIIFVIISYIYYPEQMRDYSNRY
ncbi:MAG: hypothetical protein HOC78_02290 [Candidatus Komeilibacteria bacterium]|jgi:hypothetical protein|nr:hypothetical protein [Candidatus Komeilibacteria bacterium]